MSGKQICLVCSMLLLASWLYASPQPDTIKYDDGNPIRMDTNQNALFAVRFTPVRPFNLMAIYLMFRNDYNTTDGANVWVAQNKGGLPAWPATSVGRVPPPLTDRTWIQFDLAGPMYFDKDFFIVVQQKGGFSPGPGFWIGIDYGTTTGRTFKSYNNGQGWLDEPLGDACIRAGGVYQAPGVELTPASGAVIIEQVDFRNGPNSGVGEITIVRSAANTFSGLNSGYVNATNSAGQWVVRNLPVLPDSIYDMPSITTRLDLGVANGTDVSFINLYVEYSPEPYVTFLGKAAKRFNVGTTTFAAGGVGTDLLTGYLPGPDLSKVIFEPAGAICHNYQKGHKNEQAARNQCAPMAVANSLDWLRTQKGLPVPEKHKHKPGLRSDAPADGDDPNNPSLVGELEKAMNRSVKSRKAGDGVWPLDGKLKYISQNNLKDNLDIKHRGLRGEADVMVDGVTSSGKGAKVTWEWLCQEIKKGQDVEIDIHFSGPTDGRHYVKVTGCGTILGKPYITHVSDHEQTDVDTTDTKGTNKEDFAWMDDGQLDHPKLATWNGEVDQALSESVRPLSALCKTLEGFEGFATGVCCGSLISQTWIGGLKNKTGSIVKLGTEPNYPVHSGEQSIVVIYQNNSELTAGYYSEVTADTAALEVGRDWIGTGAEALSLWLHGEQNNDAEPMYVAVQDGKGMTAVVYHDDPLATQTDAWMKWSIPLDAFASVNLADVTTLTIGLGHKGNTTIPGGMGVIYLDDIGLCRRPQILPGDINSDCVVNFADLATMADYWLAEIPGPLCGGGQKRCRYKLTQWSGSCPLWAERGVKCADRLCVNEVDCDGPTINSWLTKEPFNCRLQWELIDCAETLINRDCRNPQP